MAFVDLQKIRTLVEPIVGQLGYELVEVRFLTEQGRPLLRISIDREGGIQVGDCQRVSREIETILEVEEMVGLPYRLEVSSPGFDRPLVKETDFVRYVGKIASIKTREPIDGRRNYKGFLQGIEEGRVLMMIDGKEFKIPVGLIERAHLVY